MTRKSLIQAAVAVLVAAFGPGAVAAEAPGTAPAPVSIGIGANGRTPQPIPAGDKIELSLQQTIELALKNALDLEVSSLNYEKSAFGIGSAQGYFDPYLGAELSASRNQSPVINSTQASDSKRQAGNVSFGQYVPTGGSYRFYWNNSRTDSVASGFTLYNPTYSSSLGVQVSQPLLRNFGETVATRLVVQARIARDQSAWEYVRTIQNAIQLVENAYWDLVYAIEDLKSKKEALDRAKDIFRITRIKIDVGALAPIEIVQTEVTIAQREQAIILAEGQIGNAEDTLRRILNLQEGADWNRPIVPTDRPSDAPFRIDVEKAIQSALETRPEVKQAVADIESKKISLFYSKDQIKPQLDLVASYSRGGVGANTTVTNPDGSKTEIDYVDAIYQVRDGDFPGWAVGLNFSIPIFNRTAKENAAIASTNVELSRTSLALLKQNLGVEVRTVSRNVDTAYRSVLAARKARELAERNLDAERKKYDNGMTTSFTVAQVQNDLTTARSIELQTITAYRKSIVGWHQAVGDLLKEKNVQVAGLPVTMEPTPPEEGAVR